jgi:hypothetical protein
MNADRSFDDRLAARVRSLGLGDAASTLLEACAPLAWIGAQLGYIVEPLFGTRASRGSELQDLLENPQRMAGFIDSLHREPPP